VTPGIPADVPLTSTPLSRTDAGISGSGGCDGWDAATAIKDYTIDSSFLSSVKVCNGNDAYWLVNIQHFATASCSDVTCVPMEQTTVGKPKGAETLDGSQWGGLKLSDLVLS
jgi:hypothetical protein